MLPRNPVAVGFQGDRIPLLDNLFQKLAPGGPVYVRIGSKRMVLRDMSSGAELAIDPVLMVAGEGPGRSYRLRSQPAPTGKGPVLEKEHNGFNHPRTIIADSEIATKTLELAFRELVKQSASGFRPKPIMVLHPVEHVEGGLTPVERRALTELGTSAGAAKVYVWEGRQLSDPEIQNLGLNDDDRFAVK